MEALCEQLEREAIHKVIEKLQEDDLGIVVSIEHRRCRGEASRWSCGRDGGVEGRAREGG